MHPALWTAVTGLDAQNYDLKIISNNLANVGTTSYKKSRAIFKDLFYETIKEPGANTTLDAQNSSGFMLGSGVKVIGNQKNFEQGTLNRTNNPLDLAIKGNGFFQIQMPDGTSAFTRDGTFTLNSQGQFVTADGYPLDPPLPNIPLGSDSITISQDGNVFVNTQNTVTNIGAIQLSLFPNPTGLKPIGDNLYVETSSSGAAVQSTPGQNGLGYLEQGSLEASNVNIVEEMVKLIETQRSYEMNAKSVEAVDEMLRYISSVL